MVTMTPSFQLPGIEQVAHASRIMGVIAGAIAIAPYLRILAG